MLPSHIVTEIEKTISELRRKRDEINSLLSTLEATHQNLRSMSPNLLRLLQDDDSNGHTPNEPVEHNNPEPRPATSISDERATGSVETKKPVPAEDEKSAPGGIDPNGPDFFPDLAGTTIVEAAKSVLAAANGKPMHYSDIAAEASRRGYVGRKNNPETLRQSFWAMLNRTGQVFVPIGNGSYRLRTEADLNFEKTFHMELK